MFGSAAALADVRSLGFHIVPSFRFPRHRLESEVRWSGVARLPSPALSAMCVALAVPALSSALSVLCLASPRCDRPTPSLWLHTDILVIKQGTEWSRQFQQDTAKSTYILSGLSCKKGTKPATFFYFSRRFFLKHGVINLFSGPWGEIKSSGPHLNPLLSLTHWNTLLKLIN